MNRLTAAIIALFLILVAAVYCALLVPKIGVQTPMFGVPLLVPAFVMIVAAMFILERLMRK